MEEPVRIPIEIQRIPITYLSGKGYEKYGGWFVFKPPQEPAPRMKLGKGQRVLWCPWCGEWSVFVETEISNGATKREICSQCWAHTGEYYVRAVNDLWWEGIPLKDVKRLLSKS